MRSGVGSDGVSESPTHVGSDGVSESPTYAFGGGQRRGLRVTHLCVRGWAATGSPSHPLMRSRVGSDGVSESPTHAFEGGQRRGLRVTLSCVRGWAATGSPSHPLMRSGVGSNGVSGRRSPRRVSGLVGCKILAVLSSIETRSRPAGASRAEQHRMTLWCVLSWASAGLFTAQRPLCTDAQPHSVSLGSLSGLP